MRRSATFNLAIAPRSFLSLAVICASSCTSAPPSADLAITNVTVVDVLNGGLIADQTVLIVNDRILEISATTPAQRSPAKRIVDGTDLYLIPGLWDMHVHGARGRRAEYFWPLWLAHGITGVREMGSYVDALDHWRAESGRPGSGAPKIIWSAMHDGVPPVYDYAYPVPDPKAARAAVEASLQHGFDFIKVYDRLPRDAYFALAKEANERGVPFAGHVPELVTTIEASDAGQRSVEHPRDLLLASIPGGKESIIALGEARARYGPDSDAVQEAAQRLMGTVVAGRPDSAQLSPILERLVANGTWLTPTLTVVRGDLAPGELTTDPRLKFVPSGLAEGWRTERRVPPEQEDQVGRPIVDACLRVVGLAYRAGVRILSGTDTSGVPYVFAGSALHDELALLVDAGLSPLDALRAATINPAEFLGISDSLGSVRAGNVADLVLLDANPLEDIHNTRRIVAVVSNGQLVDANMLAKLLDEAEAAAARIPIESELLRSDDARE